MVIDVLVFDGFDELDAVGPYEVLRMAGRRDADIALAGLGSTALVRADHGMVIAPARSLSVAPDVVVVPGGGWSDRTGGPGLWAEAQRGGLPELLRRMHRSGTLVCSVCTGAMILAHAGLLRGRRATTHHDFQAELAEHGAQIVAERVVDDGDIVTCGGVTSGIDLGLHLVGRLWGSRAAVEVADEIEYSEDYPGSVPLAGSSTLDANE